MDPSRYPAMYLGDREVQRVYRGAELVWGDVPPVVPALSGAWVVYVARDADMETGEWFARPVGGAPALYLDRHNTPAIVTDKAWAPGVPVMQCTSGCWYADREPFPATIGFSFAVCCDNGTGDVGYNGPEVFANASSAALRFQVQASAVRFGVGGLNTDSGGGRVRVGPAGAAGDLYQFDRPVGTNVQLQYWSHYRNDAAQTLTETGGSPSSSDGSRFVLGGRSQLGGSPPGIPVSGGNGILMAALKIDGTPATADDRAALLDFAAGLKAGTIQ